MASKRKPKTGRPADPAIVSRASVAFTAWVEEEGVSQAADTLATSRQTIWSWCVAAHRPSGPYQDAIEKEAGIPTSDWRRPA